jgi:adenylate cyclase
MFLEIERKFLVRNKDFKKIALKSTRIVQGYLSSVPGRTVRIRIRNDRGYITIKGIGSPSGASRFEWEMEIPVKEAEELMKICEPGQINKIRFEVTIGKHLFEVDEFLDENEGLIVAEVELSKEDEYFDKPSWLGREITGESKYYNASLIRSPFKHWPIT